MLRAYKIQNLLLVLIVIAIAINSACSYCGVRPAPDGNRPQVKIAPPVSELPFSATEPATYQAEIFITIAGDSGDIEQRYFTARDRESRRTEYPVAGETTLVLIENDGQTIAALPEQKLCSTEKAGASMPLPDGEQFTDFITAARLAEHKPVNFTALGDEQVNGAMLKKFQVKFDKPDGKDSVSEAVVWVDEKIGVPVKTETYSLNGTERIKRMTIEYRNLKTTIDAGAFEAPAGCRNVTVEELRRAALKPARD